MTKIEIELEAVEHLRREIDFFRTENEKLNKKLNSLDEKKIKETAIYHSYDLLNKYLKQVFKKIGFDDGGLHNFFEENVHRYHGKEWFNDVDAVFEISAIVEENWKKAFLKIGVNPKQK